MIATFQGLILAPLLRRSMMMGREPVMSMMAKSTMNALMISLKLKGMSVVFVPQKYNIFLYLYLVIPGLTGNPKRKESHFKEHQKLR